jgi:hypothetical protein
MSDDADLRVRVAELERRLAALEWRWAPHPPAFPAPLPRAPLPRPAEAVDSRIGLTWLNAIGAGVLIAGLALAALWAHERGYLTPTLRNVIAALAAAGVFALGALGLRSGDPARRSFAVGIAAVGAASLYLVPFVAAHVDQMIPASAGGIAALIVTAALVLLAALRREPLFALFGAVGAAAYAAAGGHHVALVIIGLLAAAAGFVLSLELLLVIGALITVAATSLVTGVAAAPIAALIAGGLLGQIDRAKPDWALTRAVSLGLCGLAWLTILALRRSPRLTWAELALDLLLLLALDGARRGIFDPRRRADALPLLGWIATNLIVLVAALRLTPLPLFSLIFAAHGLALMAIGVVRRHLPTRIVALVLLGLGLFKALVVDVWRQDLGLRVLAFLALGGALLSASFLYSRLIRRFR